MLKKNRGPLLLPLIEELEKKRRDIFRKTALVVGTATSLAYLLTMALGWELTDILHTFFHDMVGWKVDELVLFLSGGLLIFTSSVLLQLRGCFATVIRLKRHGRHVLWAHGRVKERYNDKVVEAHQELRQELAELREENQLLGQTLLTLGQQFHDLAEVSGDLFWTLDATGRVRFASRTITALFGYTPEEVKDRMVTEFIAQNRPWNREEMEMIQKLMNGESIKLSCLQSVIRAKNGTNHPCAIHAVPIHDAANNITGFSGVVILSRKQHMQMQMERLLRLLTQEENGFLGTLAMIDGITSEQIRSVIQETEQASITLSQQIEGLDEQVRAMVGFLTESNQWTQQLGSSSKRQIEEDREAIHNLQSFVAGMRQEKYAEQERANQVIEQIGTLGHLVDLVQEISERTNVVAMNARIIAGRAGEQGQQFAVVAQEVRKLSGQVHDAAQQIRQGISQAVQHISNLFSDDKNREHATREEDFLGYTAQQMIKMGDNYSRLLDFNESTLKRIHDWNGDLSQRVMHLLSAIQFQDIVRQQLEQVIRVGERRSRTALEMKQALAEEALTENNLDQFHVAALLQEYVMDKQRVAHYAQTGDATPTSGSGPAIELF